MQEQLRVVCRAVADGHAEEVAQLAAHATPCARHAGLLIAALRGDAAVVRALLDNGARADAQLRQTHCSILGPLTLAAFKETVSKFAPADTERALLNQQPIVVAAVSLHSEALRLMLERGARLPLTVHSGPAGDPAVNNAVPLLALWASRLPEGLPEGSDTPAAALRVLRQVLAAGADPLDYGLIAGQHTELGVRGRVGPVCSFLLTCRQPCLLGEGVRHVLRQCAATGAGGRELTPAQRGVLLVAARLAGLREESEQLLAQASLQPLGLGWPAEARRGRAAATRRDSSAFCSGGGDAGGSGASAGKRRRLAINWSEEEEEEEEEEEDGSEDGHSGLNHRRSHGGRRGDGGSGGDSSSGDDDGGEGDAAVAPVAATAFWRRMPSHHLPPGHRSSGPEDSLLRALPDAQYEVEAAVQSRLCAEHEVHAMHELSAAAAAAGVVDPLDPASVLRAEEALHTSKEAEQAAMQRLRSIEHLLMVQQQPGGPSTSAAGAAAAAAAAAAATGPSTSAARAAAASAAAAGPSTSRAGDAPPPYSSSPAPMWHRLSGQAASDMLRRHRRHPSVPPPGPYATGHASSGGGGSPVSIKHAEWRRQLSAQLVADAAAHGLADVLELLLSQGASCDTQLTWTCPPNHTLGCQPVHSALLIADSLRSPLALAAAGGHREAVAVLLMHGAQVDMPTLRHAVWAMNAEGLAELLTVRGGGAAAPQLPSTLPSSYGESVLHCPVLLLLQRHLEVAVATSARAVLATVPARRTPAVVTLETVLACVVRVPPPRGEGAWVAAAVQHAAPELAELEGRALRIMDQLYAAGYRINVYRDLCGRGPDGVWRMGRVEGLQADELAKLEVAGRNRLLWDAYSRPEWTTKTHAACHPAFKAAVKQLLLVARFGDAKLLTQAEGDGTSPGAVAVDGMGQLPRELLHKIMADAAYPISTWAGGHQ